MHKQDLVEPNPDEAEVEEEKNAYNKILDQTKLKRKIYRKLDTREKVLSYRHAESIHMVCESAEYGRAEFHLHE